MAIGTKVKVGFDGSAVKRGLAGMRMGFSKIGGMLGRGIKAGAIAGGIGAVTALGVALKAALGIKDLADYGSGLSDMAMQTGVAVSKLVELEEALRLAGVPAKDTSRVLSTLAGNMQEALGQTGLARDAFHDLGIYMDDLRGAKVDEVFALIGQKIADSGGEIKNLERSMEGLFGARIGYGLLRLFKDPANFEKARKNVGLLAKDLEASANDLDRLADDLGGMQVQMRGVYLGIYRTAQSVFGDNPLSGLFDGFNYEQLRPVFEKIRNTMALLREEGFGLVFSGVMDSLKDQMKEMGRIFGAGVKESMGGMLGDGLRGLIPGFQKGDKDRSTSFLDAIKNNTDRSTAILQRIERQKGVAVFA